MECGNDNLIVLHFPKAGADPGFQVGGSLKIIVGGISCEKSRFYANHIFSNFRGARASP